MARVVARNVSIGVEDSTGACAVLTTRSNTATMTFTAEAPEVTTYGEVYRTRLPDGLRDWEFSVSGFWDGSANALEAIMYPILGASTQIYYGPGGSTSGCTKYTACAVCTNFSIEGSVGAAVTYSATFSGRSGSMTRATWT